MRSIGTQYVPLAPATTLILVCLSWSLLSQEYTEASGQTVPFTLTAGATAAWENTSAAVHQPAVAPSAQRYSIVARPSGATVNVTVDGDLPADSRVCVYAVNGQLLVRAALGRGRNIALPGRLGNGCYLMRVENGSGALHSVRFTVQR